MRRFLQSIDSINEWTGKFASFLVAFLMVVVVYEVVARYAFNNPTPWGFETTRFLFCALIALGGGYVLLHRGHVNVDILYSRFGVRRKAILDLVTSAFFFTFIIILLWGSETRAMDSLVMREHSESLWAPPLYPIKIAVVIGVFLILVQGLAKFVRDLVTAVTGKAERK